MFCWKNTLRELWMFERHDTKSWASTEAATWDLQWEQQPLFKGLGETPTTETNKRGSASAVVPVVKTACQCGSCKRLQFDCWVTKMPWSRKWQPTPVFLPGKFHGQRSLEGYCPRGRKELDVTEDAHSHPPCISWGQGAGEPCLPTCRARQSRSHWGGSKPRQR